MKKILGSLAVLALLAVGCGATIKSIDFDVHEPSGKTVTEKKFFNDGFGSDGPAKKAFDQTNKGDVAGAKKTLEEGIAAKPKDEWLHYDLGILNEATGDWAKAEAEMKVAQEIDPKDRRFQDELKFIAAHKK